MCGRWLIWLYASFSVLVKYFRFYFCLLLLYNKRNTCCPAYGHEAWTGCRWADRCCAMLYRGTETPKLVPGWGRGLGPSWTDCDAVGGCMLSSVCLRAPFPCRLTSSPDSLVSAFCCRRASATLLYHKSSSSSSSSPCCCVDIADSSYIVLAISKNTSFWDFLTSKLIIYPPNHRYFSIGIHQLFFGCLTHRQIKTDDAGRGNPSIHHFYFRQGPQ